MKYSMIQYITIRLALSLLSLILIIFVNFILLDYLEINPFKTTLGNYNQALFNSNNFMVSNINNDFLVALNKHYQLNDPIAERFISLAINYLTLNLGESLYYQESVTQLIVNAIGITLKITAYSTILIYIISILIGYLIHKKSQYMQSTTLGALLVLYIIPSLVIAIFLSKIYNYPILFAIVSNCVGGLFFQTILILKLLEQNQQQIYNKFLSFNNQHPQHLKNMLYILCADFPSVVLALFFASSPFVEIIFNINGIGTLIYNGFLNRDYPLILGIIFFTSSLGIIFRLITDLVYNMLYKNIQINQI